VESEGWVERAWGGLRICKQSLDVLDLLKGGRERLIEMASEMLNLTSKEN
jgi:hypothetical protein